MDPTPPPEAPQIPNRKPHRRRLKLKLGLFAIVATSCLAIIALYSGLTMSTTRRGEAFRQLAGLDNAILMYETAYGFLPRRGTGKSEENVSTSAIFTDILTGADRIKNPRGVSFLESKDARPATDSRPARAGFIDHGKGSKSLVDPWGNHYMMRIDYDGDGFIDAPDGGKAIAAKVICWSYGPPPEKGEHRSALQNPPAEWIRSW